MIESKIKPFFFNGSSGQLFGCYHPPYLQPSKDCSVVLCYPMGDEYIRFHRSYLQLARRLSKEGFPVLRFDYFGCGDSDGDCGKGSLDQWKRDIVTAVQEIKKKTNITKICILGLRLGGSIALLAGNELEGIDGIVLWDPVLSGKQYLKDKSKSHKEMLGYAHVIHKTGTNDCRQTERLGFPLTPAMITELEEFNLLSLNLNVADNILIIQSNENFIIDLLIKHLKSVGIKNPEYQTLLAPQLWAWQESFGKVQVPHQIIQSILDWTIKVFK